MWFCYCIGNTVVFILTHKFYFGLFFFSSSLPYPTGGRTVVLSHNNLSVDFWTLP